MSPRISIAIPVFNQAAYTAACLEAPAGDEEVRAVAEVIVMDNALRDDTRSVLEAAQKKLPSFKAVRLNQNTEFSAASNLGAELAGGPVLVMLNLAGDLAGAETHLNAALAKWLGNDDAWHELIALYLEQTEATCRT